MYVSKVKNLYLFTVRRGYSKNTWHSRRGGGRGVWHIVTLTLLKIWNMVFSDFGDAQFCVTARLGFKRYFLCNAFNSSRQISLKNQWLKNEKCHTGGVGWWGSEKSQKGVTYYLNDPFQRLHQIVFLQSCRTMLYFHL